QGGSPEARKKHEERGKLFVRERVRLLLLPEIFVNRHLNLKAAFARLRGIKRCGMAAALNILGIPLLGQHHRGIDDARNIARIAKVVLPQL
ncbi:hypothetical protein L0222_09775, partial [bacterium]|nr:hypothetical protein [bacterium]